MGCFGAHLGGFEQLTYILGYILGFLVKFGVFGYIPVDLLGPAPPFPGSQPVPSSQPVQISSQPVDLVGSLARRLVIFFPYWFYKKMQGLHFSQFHVKYSINYHP